MYRFCEVPGCTNETHMGWAPIGEQKGRKVCEVHFRWHEDPNDAFNLWDAFGFERPAKKLTRASLKKRAAPVNCGWARSPICA